MIQAGRTNDRTRWYDHRARAEVSFRKSRRLSGGGTRPEIFFYLPAFARGGGRKDRRLSSPKSYPRLTCALGNTFSASGGLLWRLIAILLSSERQKNRLGRFYGISRSPFLEGYVRKPRQCIRSIATPRYENKPPASASDH